jgi:hypothetical protein
MTQTAAHPVRAGARDLVAVLAELPGLEQLLTAAPRLQLHAPDVDCTGRGFPA